MGINIFYSNWDSDQQSIAKTGNPNPKNFKILKTKTIGTNCLLNVQFPDCKNCNGEKILLILGKTGTEMRKVKEIDPHFESLKKINDPFIIARFHPSKMGWDMGVHMLKRLAGKL